MRSVIAVVAALGLAVAVPGPAVASPPEEAEKPGDAAASADLLRGPAVEVQQAPGVEQSLTMEQSRYMRAAAEPRVPHRRFMAALRALYEEGGDDLQPTPDQVEAILAAEREHQQTVQTYRREHREEVQLLREVLGPAAEKLRGPNRREVLETLAPEQVDAARRIREIQQGAPKPDDAHARMWRELTEDQRIWVEARLDETVPARREQSRQEALGFDRPGAEPPSVEELARRIDALPAPQQRLIRRELAKLLERAEESAERTAPPGVDSVDLPEMESKD